MSQLIADKRIDARGLSCPMPSVKTALALETMSAGQVLMVLTDDPVSRKDLPVWAESTGNTIVALEEDGQTIKIFVKKG